MDLVEYSKGRLGEEERLYLHGRGVDTDQINRFGLGYMKGDLPSFGDSFDLWASGVGLSGGVYTFPLTDILGRVRGVQFRFEDTRRYRYLDYFEDDEGYPVLFGLSQAISTVWVSETITVVEGVFDLFPLERLYGRGIVATLTAGVRSNFRRFLSRFCNRVVVAYDNDAAGDRAYNEIKQGAVFYEVERLVCPKIRKQGVSDKYTKDFGDLWELWGDEKLKSYLIDQTGESDG